MEMNKAEYMLYHLKDLSIHRLYLLNYYIFCILIFFLMVESPFKEYNLKPQGAHFC